MKIHLLLPFFISATLMSCGDTPKESTDSDINTASETAPDTVAIDTTSSTEPIFTLVIDLEHLNYLMPEEAASLHKYVTDTSIALLDQQLVAFAETTSDTVLIKSFLYFIEFTDNLKERIRESSDYNAINDLGEYYPFTVHTEMESVQEAIPGFMNSCVAECTEYDIEFETETFLARAKKTSGTLDDEFFQVLFAVEGPNLTTEHQFRDWFAQMWDYGGATRFGEGLHLDYLKKMQTYLAKTDLGEDLLDFYKEDAYWDMLHGIYMNSPETVVAELTKIINGNFFIDSEQELLIKLRDQIKAGNYFWKDCVGQELQFNCDTGNCDFGG